MNEQEIRHRLDILLNKPEFSPEDRLEAEMLIAEWEKIEDDKN